MAARHDVRAERRETLRSSLRDGQQRFIRFLTQWVKKQEETTDLAEFFMKGYSHLIGERPQWQPGSSVREFGGRKNEKREELQAPESQRSPS